MSTSENVQQLHQDLQNELTTANQLLRLISIEVNKIKKFTAPGEILDINLKRNAELVKHIADMQQIDISNLPPVSRTQFDMANQSNQNLSYEQHDSFRNIPDVSNALQQSWSRERLKMFDLSEDYIHVTDSACPYQNKYTTNSVKDKFHL